VSGARPCPVARGPQAELLDVPYFHVVFTVPTETEVIARQNQTVVYDTLFRAASETRCSGTQIASGLRRFPPRNDIAVG
jgi:hypothetical protein